MSSAPGWYPDPDGRGGQRYFDGTNWGPQAPTATAPPPPPQKKPAGCFKTVLGVIGVLFVIGFIGSQCDSKNSISSSSSSSVRTSASYTTSAPTGSYFSPTEAAPPTPTTSFTPGQENAIAKAKSYLDYTGFSKKGLIEQLEFSQFSTADATFAVEHLEAIGDVNWNEQAVKKAKSYLEYTSFSLQGLVEQLEFSGFTESQAQYGANETYNR